MTNSNRGVLGTIFTFILGIIVGFVLLIGGIVGGAYWAYNNVKLQKINEYAKVAIIGEEYLNSTIKEVVDEIIALSKDTSGITLGKLESLFAIVGTKISDKYPDGIIPIKIDGTTLVEIDINYLRTIGLKSIGSELTKAINFSATLDALTAVGIELPNLPLINGGDVEEGQQPVDIYTLATAKEEPYAVTKNYINYEEYYSVNPYTLASDETGTILDLYKSYKNLYILDDTGYVLATDENGEKLAEYATETEFYAEKDNYTLVDNTTAIGTMPLYIKTNGIKALPIIDAFNALSSSLNFNSLSLRDLENKLGVNLKDSEGEYSFIFKSILDVPINNMTTQLKEEINNFELIELIDDDGSTLIGSLLYQDDGTTPVKVGEISGRINTLTLGGIVEIGTDSPKILKSLENSTLASLSADINNLTLDCVMEPTGALANLIYKRDENGNKIQSKNELDELLYYTDDTETETTTTVTAYIVYEKTKITEISDQINYLKIGEFLNVGTDSSSILKALADTQINKLDDRIKELTLQEILAADIYDGYEEIKATGVTLDYATYGFKNFYTDAAGTIKVDDVFNGTIFNNDYLNTVLYSEKVADSMWKFFVVDNGIEQEVKILELGIRMTQISENIRTAPLNELKLNGLLSEDTDLSTPITIGSQAGKTMGELTIEQLIKSMGEIITYVNGLGL
jgi:hypothetical protein